jgi:hypothetical protein
MTTRSDIGRALLALVLACAAWLSGGCLDSIVSADCEDGTFVDGLCVIDPSQNGGTRPDGGTGEESGDDAGNGGGEDPDGGGGGGGEDPDGGGGDPTDGGVEEPICEEPLTWCVGECVDLMTDPMHCGECMNECDSGICQEGICQDGISGHVVLIGHDFEEKNAAIGRVLGNSIFLALGDTVEVVSWRGESDADAVQSANQSIGAHAASIGRSWNRIPAASASEVAGLLATADVFLVYAQEGATGEELTALGAGWATTLDEFTARNGIVVVLGDTWPLLVGAGLLDATGTTSVSGQILRVADPSDSVGASVPLQYYGAAGSVAFTGTSAPVVVETGDGHPVVLHRPVY